MEHKIFIAIGTNLGEREANLDEAVQTISTSVQTLQCSPIYETAPVGFLDQGLFLNQVIQALTNLDPLSLLAFLKSAEKEIGRIPTFRDGPRKIDMDILFYDDLIMDMPELHIPHARLSERAFVLAPLADLAPDMLHPVLKRRIADLLADVDRSGVWLYKRKET